MTLPIFFHEQPHSPNLIFNIFDTAHPSFFTELGEQVLREQVVRKQVVREQVIWEQVIREHMIKEQVIKEQVIREHEKK